MPKNPICILCKKRAKQSTRRYLSQGIKNYSEKVLKHSIPHDSIVCGSCRLKFYREYTQPKSDPSSSGAFESSRSGDSDTEYVPPIQPPQTSTFNIQSPKSLQLTIPSTAKTHKYCIVCKTYASTRNRLVAIPREARTQVFIENGIFMDSRNRCCLSHLEGLYFTNSSLKLITGTKVSEYFSRSDITGLLQNVRYVMKQSSHLNFDVSTSLTDEDYLNLTGLDKDQFADLCAYLQSLRNSAVRSVRTCLAAFLVKLRLGLSNKVIATLFTLTKAQVQRIIHATKNALMMSFVPQNLGFDHMDHSTFSSQHTTPIASKLFRNSADQAIVVLDGTYIYIQKSSDYKFQRRSYSMHKHRPLVKLMMIVGTDGYILSVIGPYFSDGHNNDAAITEHLFSTNADNVNEWFSENDVCIVDRGFRDAVDFLEEHGDHVCMPSYLQKGSAQHSAQEANLSRLVSKVRWVVESVNGRMKKWQFFDKVVVNNLVPCIGDFTRIICAICNKYRPPLASLDPSLERVAAEMLRKSQMFNQIQQLVEEHRLKSRRSVYTSLEIDESLVDFPRLSMDSLRAITMGVYQLKQAPRYTNEHLDENGDYEIMSCLEFPCLLRVKIQSRHCNSTVHNLWIQYSTQDATDPITGWYCTCKNGARVVGCCAHVASVLWFLGLGRYQDRSQIRDLSSSLLDAQDIPSTDESDTSDELPEE